MTAMVNPSGLFVPLPIFATPLGSLYLEDNNQNILSYARAIFQVGNYLPIDEINFLYLFVYNSSMIFLWFEIYTYILSL